MLFAGSQQQVGCQAVRAGAGRGGALPAQAVAAGGEVPHAVCVAARGGGRGAAVVGVRGEDGADAGRAVDGDQLPQQDQTVRLAGEGERLAALDDAFGGDPAAAPDQSALLVVAAGDVAGARGDGVDATAADERGENGVVVPGGSAQPFDGSVGPDEGAALAVGQ
jgi:hypothetical protein